MRHTFESLGYQSGFYLSQLFSSTRNTSSSTSLPSKPSSTMPIRAPPPLFNWGPRPLVASAATASMLSSPNFQHSARLGGFPPQAKDEAHMFLQMPHHSSSDQPTRMEDMMGENENDIKWPNGLSFFNALTGQNDDATKLLFNPDSLENKPEEASNANEFLSLDSHHQTESGRKMDKFKRSFTLPARVASSSSSTSMDHHQHQHQPPVEYRNSEGGMYSDVMETFLE